MCDVTVRVPQELRLPQHHRAPCCRAAYWSCLRYAVIVAFMCVSAYLHVAQHRELQRLGHRLQAWKAVAGSQVMAESSIGDEQMTVEVVPYHQWRVKRDVSAVMTPADRVNRASTEPTTQRPEPEVMTEHYVTNTLPPTPPRQRRHRLPSVSSRSIAPVSPELETSRTTVDHFDAYDRGLSNDHDDDPLLRFRQWDRAPWSTGNTSFSATSGYATIHNSGTYLFYMQMQFAHAKLGSGFVVTRFRGQASEAVLECADSVNPAQFTLYRPCVGLTALELRQGDRLWLQSLYTGRTLDMYAKNTHWGLIYLGPRR